MPLAHLDFKGPVLLWIGSAASLPECPARARAQVYDGYAGPEDLQCPECSCSAPACVLPAELTESTQRCSSNGMEAELTSVAAPAGWDGKCAPAVPPTDAVLGSITIAPVTERPCAPVLDPILKREGFAPPWKTAARACMAEAIPGVCDPGETCVPATEPPPPEFRQCIFYERDGDPRCPDNYPEKHVFYGGVADTRGCTDCECLQTAASACEAMVTSYRDESCQRQIITASVTNEVSCHDVPSGMGLKGISATWTTNQPGTCTPKGGEPYGQVTTVDARTFCCQPLSR